MTEPGQLILVGTPLGNREDLPPRARRALLEADLLLCEDTRSPQRLLAPLAEDEQLPPRVSCFVGNEHERQAMLLEHLERGERVAFVSEAGLPVWSDPGRTLVAAAVAAGFAVDVIPGPTAASCALALSGFAAEGARFCGFLPRAGKERRAALDDLAQARGAALIYEAGNRTPALLRDLVGLGPEVGARQVVIARELSKRHQEILRGSVDELAGRIDEALRGEVTVVLAGCPDAGEASEDALDPAIAGARAALEVMLDPGLKPRARAKALAALTGLDARALYDRLRG
ncbi:16S rRNA (cytidine(1402)-2'-O)-methyltransferase [Pseudenhygromyxa sp. WMMC2535]|uniref:SAM-dependent methyltransferase n=1 Tax=Pseudenhygromyxa sp. WMMC2535 TaxID=2712867 RepID=UPI0015549337|nr:SAM-dependent methyltransferase [Pseudenhygromyxa sp. WMMC2535]NVB38292.1 16S rRNA (cytidine(1402)-2'-O)-methyltransferase [Pseudenhygromyxa sp. WMMC2535]